MLVSGADAMETHSDYSNNGRILGPKMDISSEISADLTFGSY